MKEFIFSLYNIVIFSFYFALNTVNNTLENTVPQSFVITYFYLIYLCYMMFIYLNLYKKISNEDENDRYSFYVWILCYFIILNIFVLREYNMISIESYFVFTGILTIIIFITTVMLSFYTIMKESNNWYYNIFPSIVLFWILFHDSKNTWLDKNNFYMVIPFVCMYFLKIINILEKKTSINYLLVSETIIYGILIFIEFIFCSTEEFKAMYYTIVCIMFIMDMYVYREIYTVSTVLVSPFILPVFLIYTMYAIKIKGIDDGVSDMVERLKNYYYDMVNKDENFIIQMRDSLDIKHVL
jgi:hypothetical protein